MDVVYHCQRCGARCVEINYARGGSRWFHSLASRPVFPDPDGRNWAIGHDADPVAGEPAERRTKGSPR